MAQPSTEHPYASFIHRVTKPSRYLGGEHGETVKPWDSVDARICLAFPDIYDIGMSHLGFKILYSILNGHPKLLAERAYAPWSDMERELRARNEPLRSLESFRPLSEFDVVGFSLQFELTFTNILLMLETGGIPLRSEARGEQDPLVIAGGPNATHPEPLAPFIDAFVIGDGEEKTPELLLTWTTLKQAGVPRAERLVELAKLGGVYVPALYEVEPDADTGHLVVARSKTPDAPLPVRRAFLADINQHPFPSDGPVANTETIFDRVSVEIARGCTEGCRFCQAGMIYRPVRERDPQQIVDTILGAVRDGGYDEASLTSLSTADYSAIAPLVREVMSKLEDKRVSLSVSSLRAYGLGEELLDEVQKVRATGLTFAPEAGTQRMRDVVNKNVTEEQLMETADRVFRRGWARMKLYFMIGLPTEEEEDVRGIVQTGARAQDVGKRLQHGRAPKVTVSVSTFVPKPHTPFQWCAMNPRDEVLQKQAWLREEARATRVNLRMHDSEGSWVEGVLARGDRGLADAIELAYRRGARFDSWEDQLKMDLWVQAFRETGVDTQRYLGTLPVTARLPWDHIDVGLAEGFLAKEYRKAVKNRLSPPCGKAYGMFIHHTNLTEHEADKRKLVCYHCGVACDLGEMRQERADYLVQLGAKQKAPVQPEPERPRTPNERRPTAKFDQGQAMRVRIRYTKLGRAAFRSHLDLVRLLPRIFRRLDLPLYYSQGFHPKPEMTFGPALPLGLSSQCEYVDIKLVAQPELTTANLQRRLTGASLEGVTFLDARVLGETDASISKVLNTACYVAGLPGATLTDLDLTDEAALRALVAEKLAGEMSVVRYFKGIRKTIRVGEYLRDVAVGTGAQALAEAGLTGELIPMAFTLRFTGQGGARPYEVLEALFGDPELPARTVRTSLTASGVDAMDLPAIAEWRRAQKAAAEAAEVVDGKGAGATAAEAKAPTGTEGWA